MNTRVMASIWLVVLGSDGSVIGDRDLETTFHISRDLAAQWAAAQLPVHQSEQTEYVYAMLNEQTFSDEDGCWITTARAQADHMDGHTMLTCDWHSLV
jgi:hypothetical protein